MSAQSTHRSHWGTILACNPELQLGTMAIDNEGNIIGENDIGAQIDTNVK
jgi:hypothetical protein